MAGLSEVDLENWNRIKSPEVKARQVAAGKAAWQDPGIKARRSAAIKEGHARRRAALAGKQQEVVPVMNDALADD